jgi:hypothetical protein
MLSFIDQFKAARKCGVPLIAIETNDEAATMKTLLNECGNGHDAVKPCAVLTWNSVDGMNGLNAAGEEIALKLNESPDVAAPVPFLSTIGITDSVTGRPEIPAGTIIGMHSAGDWFTDAIVRQGIWNLRDKFKRDGRTLVLLGLVFDLPMNLKNGDVVVLEDELPNEEQLTTLVKKLDEQVSRCKCGGEEKDCKTCKGTGVKVKRPKASDEAIERVVEAVKGLSKFGAEQVISMALRSTLVEKQVPVCGIDLEHCWTAKRKQIEQTRGLSIYRESTSFANLGGLGEIKDYLTSIMTGRKPPKVIVWLDEIEKSGLASRQESSGTNIDQEGELLKFMEDQKVFGIMLLGVPGCGKSEVCKCMSGEFDRVVIRLDLGALQDKYVGGSQQSVRAALKMIKAVGGKDTLWLATSNSIDGLSSAMKSRFTDTYYFDLPTHEERLLIWSVWLKKYGLIDKPYADDDSWVARDIVHCCDKAFRTNQPIASAALRITPVGLMIREDIKSLRAQADNRYLSASKPGVYQVPKKQAEPERAMMIE